MNITNKIIYFIFFSVIIFILKPKLVYKNQYSFREFGVGVDSEGHRKTLFNIFVVNIIVISILSYF